MRVTVLGNLSYDGQSYVAGDELDMPAGLAHSMPWAVSQMGREAAPPSAPAPVAQAPPPAPAPPAPVTDPDVEAVIGAVGLLASVDDLAACEDDEKARPDGGRAAVLAAIDVRFEALMGAESLTSKAPLATSERENRP